MRRSMRLVVVVPLVIAVAVLAAGCAATREAYRRGGEVAEFRLPAAETVDIRIMREQTVGGPVAPMPPSVSDESVGRWLTLFQMDINPSETAGVPPAAAESP